MSQGDFTLRMTLTFSKTCEDPKYVDVATRIPSVRWWMGCGIIDGTVPGSALDFGLSERRGHILFGVGVEPAGATVVSDQRYDDGLPHTVVAVRSLATWGFSLYIDGVLLGSGIGSNEKLTGPASVELCRSRHSNIYFTG